MDPIDQEFLLLRTQYADLQTTVGEKVGTAATVVTATQADNAKGVEVATKSGQVEKIKADLHKMIDGTFQVPASAPVAPAPPTPIVPDPAAPPGVTS